LDAASIRAVNPTAVVTVVSAFGSDGPQAGRIGYDIVAQAYSGLLMADARPDDTVPRRSGGIPYSDITAGMLACVSVLAGLAGRSRQSAPHLEVSLLGAALATQVQDFVRTDLDTRAPESAGTIVTATDLQQVAQRVLEHDELEPYYRCYEAADGFFALACLNVAQRRRVLAMLRLQDPWVENPQLVPSSAQDRATRVALSRRFAEIFAGATAAHWVAACASADVPAGEVRLVHQLFDDEQVRANGLVQQIEQQRGGSVAVLGSLFKIDGTTESSSRPAPRLGEHTESILTELDLAAPFPQLDDAELGLARRA
jgi:crotonobetainyl-CoA:carnitine CoA-transferase CaiB-like acyl-CoA transferase